MTDSASDRSPVIVGAAQRTDRWDPSAPRLDPLRLMEDTVNAALADTGATTLRERIDGLWVVNTVTWSYSDAPGTLATRLGLRDPDRVYTAVGGNGPQALVNRACTAIQAGKRRAVVITGAEAGCSAQRAARDGLDLGWLPSEAPTHVDGDDRIGVSPREFAYDLTLPVQMYPLIETTLRARAGHTPDEHREFLGHLCERFADVASRNPHAWFRVARSAAEIASPTGQNRYVGYPYTKLMNAIITVDQAAALIVVSEAEAAALGIARERWVYPMGGASMNDIWHATERPRLDESPAIRLAARTALAQAGLRVDEIDLFDIYSCFPSAVQLACEALGIDVFDERGLTVTGGLPYFGGPGNNYSTHAIATVVERIRRAPGSKALITALGWYATKHSVGVYGDRRSRGSWAHDLSGPQGAIDASALPAPLAAFDGTVTAEAFVVRHGRDGTPRAGVVMGRTQSGERVLATMDVDAKALTELEQREVVGTRWRCRHDASTGKNSAHPA